MINFCSFHSLPFGYFITLILQYFKIPLETDVVYHSNRTIDDSSLHEEESSHLNSDDEGHLEADPAATSVIDIFSALVNVQNTQDLLLKNQASLHQAFESLQIGQDALLRKFHPFIRLRMNSLFISSVITLYTFLFIWSVITLFTLILSFLSMTKG